MTDDTHDATDAAFAQWLRDQKAAYEAAKQEYARMMRWAYGGKQ